MNMNLDLLAKTLGEHSLSLILPDGFYGRPFDNTYTIKHIFEDQKYVQIVFQENIELAFDLSVFVENKVNSVTFNNFEEAIFKAPNKNKIYKDGAVELRFL